MHVNCVASLLTEIKLQNLSQYPALIDQLKIKMLNIYKNDFVLLLASMSWYDTPALQIAMSTKLMKKWQKSAVLLHN